MGEIKSVKVDNWGVFFLQKLQNFFNKTDYCDLTLQFNDNSQLKVHRLVLSACTDYFNVLEQTCEMIDDVLIMPLELQADVVVPIVNFMYTGTLEFELRMYGKLLKTARDMNMTVLLKLLEAHRRTMERNPPHALNRMNQRNTYQRKVPSTSLNTSSHNVQRRVQTPSNYKSLQIKPATSYYPNTSTTVQNLTKFPTLKAVKGPSRFDYPEGKVLPPETFEQSFDTISYESKPLICKEEPDSEDYEHLIQKNSPFEELRRGYNNNKRPASSVSSFESPPEKKPNIEDVKEYAEQQRVRKQIAQEFEEDNEYEEVLDDEFHHDDDDDDYIPPVSYQKQVKQKVQQQKKTSKSQQQPIVIKQENDQPTIVVKDVPNASMNHAKIISEVLRKYPHLVKNNKNIKLKILPKSSDGKSETQKIVVKKELDSSPVAVPQLPPPSVKHNTYPSASQRAATITAGTSLLQSKTSSKSILASKSAGSSASTSATISQPRRIDSKTMHSLIAMGAENRTGPWLCLRCGINGRPISIPSYRGFRRHLINTHQEKIDPRLCEHCGWRSTNNRELYHHMLADHKIKPPTSYNFPKCELCDTILLNYSDLEKHIAENHEEGIEVNQSCIYCNRTFVSESMLFAHMKLQHKERAREDGVIDFSEDDDMAFESDSQLSQYHSDTGSEQKIKIISDISIPKNIPIIQAVDNAPGTTITLPPDVLESSSSKLIDGSQGPRFVNADGKEMELTEEQRQEIISQLENQDHGAVVMVLNDDADQLSSVLSGVTTSNSDSIKSVEKTTRVATVEKDLHKPRKTKHTVKTEDVEEGEEMIEWLDEESGNIMKVPLSKFSKMGELEADEDEEVEEEGGEDEEVDTETEKPSKEDGEEIESTDEEKTRTGKDEKPPKDKDEPNDDKQQVKSAVDSTKTKKKDEKDKTPEAEKKKDEKISEKKEKSSTKVKTEVSKAMETLKILTGDWTDEEEDEDVPSAAKKEPESNTEHKTDESKDEVLFETAIDVKTEKVMVKEENDTEKKPVDTKKQSNDNESCEKDKSDIDMELDDIVTTQRDETDILKVADDKLDDVIDDDMKIIEELKNYEQEQLAAAAKEKDSAAVEEKMRLRHKSKSKSKSASPAMSEGSNSGHSNVSGNSDKRKKRGRPRKTPSIIDDQKTDSQDKDDEKVIEDNDKEISDDKNKEEVQEDKQSEKDDITDKESNIIEDEKISTNENENENENSQSSNKIEQTDENEKKSGENEEGEDENGITESEIVSEEQKLKNSTISTNPNPDNDGLITKAEIRNLISDWGDDDDDDADADL